MGEGPKFQEDKVDKDKIKFFVDSGCTDHMINSKSIFFLSMLT